jgi:hypothetical protein
MLIKVGFEISYTAVQPTPMVIMLSIHPSRYSDIVGTETIVAEPNVPIGFYRDSFGNVCGRLVAPAGGVTLRGSALESPMSWCRPRCSFRSINCPTTCCCT